MTTNPTLDDLRVLDTTPPRTQAAALIRHRPATREDILTVLRELGGWEIQWCKYHDAQIVNLRDGLCWDAEPHHSCQVVKRLIIPIEES